MIVARIRPKGLELLKELDLPVPRLNVKILGPVDGSRLRSLLRLLDEVREAAA